MKYYTRSSQRLFGDLVLALNSFTAIGDNNRLLQTA